MNVRKKIRMTAMAGVALMAASCSIGGHHGNGDDNFFSAFTTFDDARWIYADGIEYVVDTLKNDSSSSGDFVLTLRHTPAYEYSNIWLEIDYNLDEGGKYCDTFNIILADEYGRWRGKGSGASFSVSDTIIRNACLRSKQRIGLRHIMRTDTLNDIELIGLTYLPHDN